MLRPCGSMAMDGKSLASGCISTVVGAFAVIAAAFIDVVVVAVFLCVRSQIFNKGK